jgi:hypothetical protein
MSETAQTIEPWQHDDLGRDRACCFLLSLVLLIAVGAGLVLFVEPLYP